MRERGGTCAGGNTQRSSCHRWYKQLDGMVTKIGSFVRNIVYDFNKMGNSSSKIHLKFLIVQTLNISLYIW